MFLGKANDEEDDNPQDPACERDPEYCQGLEGLQVAKIMAVFLFVSSGVCCIAAMFANAKANGWSGPCADSPAHRNRNAAAPRNRNRSRPGHCVLTPGGLDYKDVELVVVTAPNGSNARSIGLSCWRAPGEDSSSLHWPRVQGVPAEPGLQEGLSPLLKKDFITRVGYHSTQIPATSSKALAESIDETAALLRGHPVESGDSDSGRPAIMLPVTVRRSLELDAQLYPDPYLDLAHKEYETFKAPQAVCAATRPTWPTDIPVTASQAQSRALEPLLEVVIPRSPPPAVEPSAGTGGADVGIAFHVLPMVITYVAPWSPAFGKLLPGDYVVDIDDRREHSSRSSYMPATASDVLLALANAPPHSEDPDNIHLLIARPRDANSGDAEEDGLRGTDLGAMDGQADNSGSDNASEVAIERWGQEDTRAAPDVVGEDVDIPSQSTSTDGDQAVAEPASVRMESYL